MDYLSLPDLKLKVINPFHETLTSFLVNPMSRIRCIAMTFYIDQNFHSDELVLIIENFSLEVNLKKILMNERV